MCRAVKSRWQISITRALRR